MDGRRLVGLLALLTLLLGGGLLAVPPAVAAASGQICYHVPHPADSSQVLAQPCLEWAALPAWESWDWDVTRVLVRNPVPVWALIRFRYNGGLVQSEYLCATNWAYHSGYQRLSWADYVYFQFDTVCVWLRPDNRLMTRGACPA
jgi:hypothetical protein